MTDQQLPFILVNERSIRADTAPKHVKFLLECQIKDDEAANPQYQFDKIITQKKKDGNIIVAIGYKLKQNDLPVTESN